MSVLNKILLFSLLNQIVSAQSPTDLLSKFNQNDFKINFERVEVMSYDKDIFKQLNLVTFKYNRTTTAINFTEEFRVDIKHDYDIVVQAYKLYSNEYREIALRFRVNFCDAMERNIFGLQGSLSCGNFTGCPYKKNVIMHACNFHPDERKFPPLIPSGSYKLELDFIAETFSKKAAKKLHAYGTIYRPVKY